VLTVRPIAAAEDLGGWRAALLNGAAESGRPAPTGMLAEFIVRVDDGATLSIVQPNDAGLRVGERVVLARPSAVTGSPRLARPL
jgi:outer membrane lipoprotein SlyB